MGAFYSYALYAHTKRRASLPDTASGSGAERRCRTLFALRCKLTSQGCTQQTRQRPLHRTQSPHDRKQPVWHSHNVADVRRDLLRTKGANRRSTKFDSCSAAASSGTTFPPHTPHAFFLTLLMDATVKSNDLKISAFVGALHSASEGWTRAK